MIKKIITYILIFLIGGVLFSQSLPEDQYNSFSSRSFLKFDNFFTVPTFSLMNYNGQSVGLLSRVSNTQFEDAPQLHVLNYSGRLSEKAGVGVAVFQQNAGVFSDFGAIANYAYQLQMGSESSLTLGFNFFYGRRGLNESTVLSSEPDGLVSNYQNKSVVVFQPAVTYQYKDFYGGIFLENLVDFNLKDSEMVSEFADKTISAHLGYGYTFENADGLFSDARLNVMGIARRAKKEGFSYGGNMLIDLPKAGWIKGGYDKLFGFNAGLGVNISERLSIGYAYESQENLGATNEFGIVYKFGDYKRRKSRKKRKVEVVLPEKKDKELAKAKDSIKKLNTTIKEIIKDNPSKPPIIIRDTIVVRDTIRIETQKTVELDNKDTSLRRRNNTPWRNAYETIDTRGGGGGGTMYYVAVNQFKDLAKAKAIVKKYAKKDVKARYIKDPSTNFYYIYIDRFVKKEDADRLESEINGGKKGFEKDVENDLGLKMKSVSKDPVYVIKINLGSGTQTQSYRKPKKNAPARVREMVVPDAEPGYYIRVFVNGQKSYADRNVDELRADDFEAGYFTDPKTGYRHVYIFKTNNRDEAIRMYNSNLNGTYYDTKAIIYIR